MKRVTLITLSVTLLITFGLTGCKRVTSDSKPEVTPTPVTEVTTSSPAPEKDSTSTPSQSPIVTETPTVQEATPSVSPSATPSGTTATKKPSSTVKPSSTAKPSTTSKPVVTTPAPTTPCLPSAPAKPTTTSSPGTTQAPAATQVPGATSCPDCPTASPTPVVTATPVPTKTPAVTSTPAPTKTPAVTSTPAATKTPEVTMTPEPTKTPEATVTPVPTKTPAPPLSYDGYELKWNDDFNGTSLNTDDWNYEVHDKGWVNNELQEYVKSDQNVYVKDGNLVIEAIKTVDEAGNVSYTSGRINTQGKQDFKYGLFEVKAKVPNGTGFLPAFWMMPTDENLYGQWPRCGEIDIMEVLGSKTDTLFGTIHYGNPHRESQGSHTLNNGNFADEYHTFTCEWEPGKISWYMDGILYHTENDWFSTTVGQGQLTYPAPFDQPFYMILNLAVGGNWPGNPDETNQFDQAKFIIDSVKVYQKDSYDEDVTKPEKDVILRDPDANGNYINNHTFQNAESLDDDDNWGFKLALGGQATATLINNSIKIATTNAGTVDYSVQLVQPNIPMKKGATYQLSFDAYADAARTMKTGITAPDYGYSRYFPDTSLDLTTDKKEYTYTFKMKDSSDANARLEFNLGGTDSNATVYISNVRLTMVKDADPNEVEDKTILADGNHVYNGAFQEGTNRLAYWEITNRKNASVFVTNVNNIRELKVTGTNTLTKDDVLVGQSALALSPNKKYLLTFDARNDLSKELTVAVAGQIFTETLSPTMKTYSIPFTTSDEVQTYNLLFSLGLDGVTYLDNVRIVEDTMIKNGDFSAGFAGYEIFTDSSADATYVVDSLNEDNAADFTIRNTSDQDWKIQLKQNNVGLENGKWYKLTFKAKSSLDRKIRVIMQGGEEKGWAVYSGENTVSLTEDYQTFEKVFQMTADTDPQAFLSICLGAINNEQISVSHRVCIDDIAMEEVQAPVVDAPETDGNLLKNGDFSEGQDYWTPAITSPGEASFGIDSNVATFDITNVGTEDWNVQLKQEGLALEQGKTYKVSFTVVSSETRTIKLAMLSSSYAWYGGDDLQLTAGEAKNVEVTFTMNASSDPNTTMVISMGKIDGQDTPISKVSLSNLSLVTVD